MAALSRAQAAVGLPLLDRAGPDIEGVRSSPPMLGRTSTRSVGDARKLMDNLELELALPLH
jgi:hypothetical protein